MAFATIAGTWIAGSVSRGPASTSATLAPLLFALASPESRFASTQPAVPAPAIT